MSLVSISDAIGFYHRSYDKLDALLYNVVSLVVDSPLHECSYDIIEYIMRMYPVQLVLKCDKNIGSSFIAYVITIYTRDRYVLQGLNDEIITEVSYLLEDCKLDVISIHARSSELVDMLSERRKNLPFRHVIEYKFGMDTTDLFLYSPESLTKLYRHSMDYRVIRHLLDNDLPLVFDASAIDSVVLDICTNTDCPIIIRGTYESYMSLSQTQCEILLATHAVFECTTPAVTYQMLIKCVNFGIKPASDIAVGIQSISKNYWYQNIKMVEDRFEPKIREIMEKYLY